MKKIILLFVVLVISAVVGCATMGDKIDLTETDLVKLEENLELIVTDLVTSGWINQNQADDVKAALRDNSKLLESVQAARNINNKVESEQYLEALLDILVELEKHKQDK